MENYSTNERRADILQLLNQNNRVTVNELCEKYGLSEVTIRKDLEILKNRNLLFRIRGGAIRIPSINIDGNDVRVESKRLFYYKQKKAIGKMAASLINENETIIIDSGTTTMEVAKNLHNFQNLTIVTNAIDIALEVSKYNRFSVIMLGGHLRESSLSTVGPLAESVLKVCYCDKLFLGVDSINIDEGISTPNIEEANINQTMITMAKETIAVFDSSKFDKRSFAFIAHVKDIDAIVTDDDIPHKTLTELTERKIKVHIASYR
jgi:DeoR/GlpR family transcriptional regulator of sugar metabolism